MLRILDVPLYLVGQRRAVERVCQSKWSLVIGALLVVTAVIARNYDQAAILYHRGRILAPYAFSLASSLWTFWVLYRAYRLHKAETEPTYWQQYATFLGAFWMTAPIAWLYGIPVERWLDPVAAAKANVWLLVIVSLWRVLLITRVASIMTGASFWASGVFVSAAASFEFIVAGVVRAFMNFEDSIVSGMAGILLQESAAKQATDKMIGDLASVLLGVVIVSTITALGLTKLEKRPFPQSRWEPSPSPLLLTSLIALPILLGYLIAPIQRTEMHWSRLESMLLKRDYEGALDYLENVGPDAFPKGKALPIAPNNYRALRVLPELLPHLTKERPEWVHQLYREQTLALLQSTSDFTPINYITELTEAIMTLPDGERFILEHSNVWLKKHGGAEFLEDLGIKVPAKPESEAEAEATTLN